MTNFQSELDINWFWYVWFISCFATNF